MMTFPNKDVQNLPPTTPDPQQISAAQRAAQLDKATKARIATPPVHVQYTKIARPKGQKS